MSKWTGDSKKKRWFNRRCEIAKRKRKIPWDKWRKKENDRRDRCRVVRKEHMRIHIREERNFD